MYNTGFGNEFATEALPGALPARGNSPQRVKYGLYAEQFSGSSFTVPRAMQKRSWLYRIRPSVMHEPSAEIEGRFLSFDLAATPPNQLRWDPLPIEDGDFVDTLTTIAGTGDPVANRGVAGHICRANGSMTGRSFCDAGGELLIVPGRGGLNVRTELGTIGVKRGEIGVGPRGTRLRVELEVEDARGYVCEN